MSESRSSLLHLLQEEFKHPEKKASLKASALKILHAGGNASRIFDPFPCLISADDIMRLTQAFQAILLNTKENNTPHEDNSPTSLHESDIEQLTALEKDISATAITELLDEKGHIKNELIELLGWQAFKKNLGATSLTYSIVCAFVSAINQEIVNNSKEFFRTHGKKTSALFHHVNQHLDHWLIDLLNHKKLHLPAPENPPRQANAFHNNVSSKMIISSVVAITSTALLFNYQKKKLTAEAKPEGSASSTKPGY